ncbi:MAG: hypothetical protein ACK4P1_02570 [Aggregatilineales bacterium]
MTPLTPEDFELLSAYLDEALSARQREALEARLAASAELRAQLDELRAMHALLRSAPVLRLPRDFRLDPAAHARRAWWARLETLRLTSALSAAAAVLLIALGVLLSNLPRPSAQPVALQPTAAPTSAVFQAAEPPTPTNPATPVQPPALAPIPPTAALDLTPAISSLMATEAPPESAEVLPPALPPVVATVVATAEPFSTPTAEPTPQADTADQGAPDAQATLSPLARLAILSGVVLLIVGGVLFLIAAFQRRL